MRPRPPNVDPTEPNPGGPRLRGMNQENIDEPIDPAAVQRELTHSLERTESIGHAIEEALDAAEQELAEIKRIGIPRALSP